MKAHLVVSMCGGRHWCQDCRAGVAKFLGSSLALHTAEWRALTEFHDDLLMNIHLMMGILDEDIAGVSFQNIHDPELALDAFASPPREIREIVSISHVSIPNREHRRQPFWGTSLPRVDSPFRRPVDLAIVFDDPKCGCNETPLLLRAMQDDSGPRRALIVCDDERRGPISIEASMEHGIAPPRIWPMHSGMFEQQLPLLLGDLRSSAPRVLDA